MNTGGEVAGVIASMYAEIGKKGLDMGSQLASFLFMALLKSISGKLNQGQTNMKKLLESGEELKQIKLNERDKQQFISKAKKTGLTFALLDEKADKEGNFTIFFKANDSEIVQALLKQIEADRKNNIEEKIDKSIIDEFCIMSDKDIFIADRENPENYIQVSLEKTDLKKGYIVNLKNPDEYIYFEENQKDKTVSLEIHSNGKVEKFDSTNSKFEDRVENIRKVTEKWGATELVFTDEERIKLRDKADEERKNATKADKDKKKTLNKVKDEVKETRDKQPSKDSQTKTKSKSKSKKGKAR